MKNKTWLAILGGFGAVFLIVVFSMVGWWIHTGNTINQQQQACDAQWSQVQNVMQRRADLIPNLTATVKVSMHNEQKIFGEIAKSRQQVLNTNDHKQKMKADYKLNQQVGTLINVIHEKYPELASNSNVQDLMLELESSENRISVERHRYIQDVQSYNTMITNFPNSIVANGKGDHKIDYYQADSNAQKAPKVNLE